MATAYKAPGVYNEEITKFPPSIASVETAIPAFIGYTKKAVRNGAPLLKQPTRIESIAEYELLFGGAPSQDVTVFLDTNNQFVRAEAVSKFYLYDSLRMFYANGGGICYIVSVGSYDNSISSADLEEAISILEQEDEPTIILGPDAVSAANGPYEFQKKALIQCNKLMDRVTMCDLERSVTNKEFNDNVIKFRENIGINYLKYGAAYGPWIRANLPRTLLHRNVTLRRDGSPTVIQLNSLTTDPDIRSLIEDLITVEKSVSDVVSARNNLAGGSTKTLEDKLKSLLDVFNTMVNTVSPSNGNMTSVLEPLSMFVIDILNRIKERYDVATGLTTSRFKLKDDIDNYIANSKVKASLETLVGHHNYLSGLTPGTDSISLLTTSPLDTLEPAAKLFFGDASDMLGAGVLVTNQYTSATNAKERGEVAIGPVLAAVNEAIAFFYYLESVQNNYEKTLNDALLTAFGTYKELVTKGADALNLLPPSGAIAGVYAATDRDRGVWKAPANVSLNTVVSPSVKITQDQQAEYNVDVNAGKSINIIRAFTGKGVLVWGARTLAGNDNEWRYVNVRRFFNYVEESVKKTTEQFLFEPNDANTWVRIQAMIENFLTFLWRQGALQGIKPEHAFYVAVGLGKTMTAVDILEGRLIVEIGMAAVRPAEFIIIRYSHKMAES